MQDGMHRLRLGTQFGWLLCLVFRGLTQIYDFPMIISEGLTSPSFHRLDSSASTILYFTSSRCQGDCNHHNLAFLRQTAPWRCPFSIRLSEPEGNQLGRCRLWPLFEDPSLQKFHFFNSKIAKNEDRLKIDFRCHWQGLEEVPLWCDVFVPTDTWKCLSMKWNKNATTSWEKLADSNRLWYCSLHGFVHFPYIPSVYHRLPPLGSLHQLSGSRLHSRTRRFHLIQ